MTYRYIVDVLASGQPRPYADSRSHVRLTIEIFYSWLGDPKDPRSEWKPNDSWKEDEVKELLKHLRCGFPRTEPTDHWDTKLTGFTNPAPGVWEFTTSTPYTD